VANVVGARLSPAAALAKVNQRAECSRRFVSVTRSGWTVALRYELKTFVDYIDADEKRL
jgi:hypothetical protein